MLSEETQLACEIQVVDQYKRYSSFDVVMLRELEHRLSTTRVLFGSWERSTEDARRRWDRVIEKHKANSLEVIKNQKIRDISLEDQSLLSSCLPLLREFLPSHAAEIEVDIHAKMSEKDDFVYDYYTVNDDMKVDDDDGSNPFPLVQVDDKDYYDGPDESEYDSEDSNAENNPQNDYPDKMSREEEEEEEEEDDGVEIKAFNESEDSSEGGSVNVSRDPNLLHDDDLYYDDFNVKDDDFDYYDDNDDDGDNGGYGEDWRWSYR
ncbi:hypothetical protein LWI29_021093 [Acer saccharum]|uniref:Transcription factor Iwr1 domain-containing protein n=1 Tax=Acer saccharum TaxID=4024 RepID=A0AA39SWK9_ACESA|nr:hypothetical protein LWI29_021093 [Acer saccharum]